MKQAMIDYVKKPKTDHFNTPEYAVEPLLKYINPDWTVWEPTDTYGKSKITEVLRKHGNKVISTNKKQIDFRHEKPDFEFDCIVTNPPYSWKDEFIMSCMAHGKPWALLLPLIALEEVNRGVIFRHIGKKFGVLVLDQRTEFTEGSVWFNTSWFCYGLLPRQLIFTELQKGGSR
jgi:hypothetical protein